MANPWIANKEKNGEVLDGEWDLYYLHDMLASQYQSMDWTQHTTCQEVSQLGDFFGS